MLSLGLAIGIAVAVVICIGALVALVLLGLRRYGLTIGVNQEDKPDMEWDNSELNITVNPLDVEGAYEEDDICATYSEQKVITDDVIHREGLTNENGSDEEGEEPGDREDGPVCKDVKELEWDDSVLVY